jgi:hypothetical protein
VGVVRTTAEDDATTRALVITPSADAQRVLGTRLASFSGVLDAERQIVAGVLVGGAGSGSPYFVMSRSSNAEAAFLKTVRNAATARPSASRASPVRAPRGIPIRIPGGGRSPGQDEIRRWAARLLDEYPDIVANRTEQGRLFAMARNLFRDEYFQPHFGRTFDALGPNDLQRIRQEITGIPAPRANFPEERANGAARAVERGFATMTGTYTAPDITLSVIAMRSIQAWRTQTLAWLQKASGDVLGRIATIERAESQVLAMFWPSERTAFAGVLASSRSRVAGPVLRARLDELLNQSASYDAVPRLIETLAAGSAAAEPTADGRRGRAPTHGRRTEAGRTAPQASSDDIGTLLGLVSSDLRQEQLARVSSRIDHIVEEETRRDRETLAGLGTGLEGLQAGGRWHAEAAAKYRPVPTHQAVQALMRELAERRAPLLQKMEGPLTSRIRAARNTSEVNQLRSTYLSVTSDHADPVGGRLLQVAQTQHAELRQEEQVVAAIEAEERRQAASPCARAATENGPDSFPGEPTERDMCLTIERGLRGAQQELEDLKNECHGLNAQNNFAATVLCLGGTLAGVGGGPQLSLRGFRKIACSPAVAVGRPGYFCDYVTDLVTANPQTAPIVNRFGGAMATARFVRSGGSWIFLPVR